MVDISKIVKDIEELTEKGELDEDNVAWVRNLSEEKAIMFRANYAGNRGYKIKSKVVFDTEKDDEKKYHFIVKYVGVKK